MSDSSVYLTLAQEIVNDALEAGASQCEVGISIGDRFSAEARDTTITKVEQSKGKSMQVRVFVEGRRATLPTSDFDRPELADALERAGSADPEKVRDALATLDVSQGYAAMAPGGRVKFGPDGKNIYGHPVGVQWQGGDLASVFPKEDARAALLKA